MNTYTRFPPRSDLAPAGPDAVRPDGTEQGAASPRGAGVRASDTRQPTPRGLAPRDPARDPARDLARDPARDPAVSPTSVDGSPRGPMGRPGPGVDADPAAPHATPGPAGVDRSAGSAPQPTPRQRARMPAMVGLFLISLLMPFGIEISGIYLTPQRIVLLIAVIPVIAAWASGHAGPRRWTDSLVLTYAAWSAVCFTIDGANSTHAYAALSVLETITPFLIARVYIRTPDQYLAVARWAWWIALVLLPAAVLESAFGWRIYNDIVDLVFESYGWAWYEQRWGMYRAQTVFEHPILFGVFIAMTFAPVYMASRISRSAPASLAGAWPVIGCVFFCLSAGAYSCLNVQALLLAWGGALRRVPNRWKILGALSVLAYIVIDIGSNRTPFAVLTSYISFDPHTAYWRVLILDYGLDNVWARPLFGRGLEDWVRPAWMHTASVDNYWLLMAMRFGIPGFLLVVAYWIGALSQLMRARIADPQVAKLRDGHAIALIGLAVAIVTVHVWSATYLFVMFLLGCCALFADQGQAPGAITAARDGAAPQTGSDRSVRPAARRSATAH